jgi:hypothetical protein
VHIFLKKLTINKHQARTKNKITNLEMDIMCSPPGQNSKSFQILPKELQVVIRGMLQILQNSRVFTKGITGCDTWLANQTKLFKIYLLPGQDYLK